MAQTGPLCKDETHALSIQNLWIYAVISAMVRFLSTGKYDRTMAQTDNHALQIALNNLLSEHRDLDDVIERLSDDQPFDQLQIKRLKKRKLILKDEIIKLRAKLLPDIIA